MKYKKLWRGVMQGRYLISLINFDSVVKRYSFKEDIDNARTTDKYKLTGDLIKMLPR